MLRGGGRRVRRDLASGEIEVEFDWQGWRTRILASNTEMGEQNVTRYRIIEGRAAVGDRDLRASRCRSRDRGGVRC